MQLPTQWYCGTGGRTGLNYLVVLEMIDRLELSKTDAKNMFEDIRHMEIEALSVMSKD